MDDKNIAEGLAQEIMLEEGFFLLRFRNEQEEKQLVTRPIGENYIQFHFCVKGAAGLVFNHGNYKMPLKEESACLLYNPDKELPLNLELQPHSWVVTLFISIRKFHALFSEEAEYIRFLSIENRDKKYYKNSSISPTLTIVLNQILNYSIASSIKPLYYRAKAYELLSLYFNDAVESETERCPFLSDEENVLRIRRAKDLVIRNFVEPPTLQELSSEVGLSLKKLKEGFKKVYGDSVYSFLFDYKMEYARRLLDSGEYNVNEVGLKVGYSTSSHFIAAFKKKYGTTPKKYLMALAAG